MNIFALSEDPEQAAKWQVDKHVVKMLLEHCQMLCTTFHLQHIIAPYKRTHENHPCSRWVRSSYDNFKWTLEHAYSTASEYKERYGRRHKSQDVLDWCNANTHRLSFSSNKLSKFAIAINEDSSCRALSDFNENDSVNCYRLFYINDKKHLHNWKQNMPSWISL